MSADTKRSDPQAAAVTLRGLGWKSHFQQQLNEDEALTGLRPARVTSVRRSGLHVLGPDVDTALPPFVDPEGGDGANATIGDWLLLDSELPTARHMLERFSLFKRRSPGTGRAVQLIAANVDTVFIVTSCNQDFNVARLERYLTLARQAEVTPVFVLTKPDLADDPEAYVEQAQALDRSIVVECVNAKTEAGANRLLPWCGAGQTVVFVGSSGVGKSTLVKTLTGEESIVTQGIREDDAKGRHTTSARELYQLASGAWLVDTPGMRELSLADVKDGLEIVFADLSDLSEHCRFNDCAHEAEPGCAVKAAIARGEIDAQRVERWKKLVQEEAHNAMSLVEKRAKDKALGKMIKTTLKGKRR
ncbi:ribosome small subunit-dependent GTPase A [Pararhodobacter oceanensis]|uniref:Small ribosomal subunit biogenesis GTPase RsgA n=1 Tax=Pararhodobacter oceanensis TaxID=2172121 RepID=A0A2T8HQM5_9RHOB|nr:ribosome small subunit-dependent GTPase A [Pararhodobacter oceanensis]PVH27715.1 ribosome small subunit-dependent GTPase A [Pararhodobacter oceanensis]